MFPRLVGLLLGNERKLGEDDVIDTKVIAQFVHCIEELAMLLSFLGLEKLIDDTNLILCGRIIGPSCKLGVDGVGVPELARSDRWENSCDFNGLEDTDGSPVPKPMREDMGEVWIVNCLTPCL